MRGEFANGTFRTLHVMYAVRLEVDLEISAQTPHIQISYECVHQFIGGFSGSAHCAYLEVLQCRILEPIQLRSRGCCSISR